MNASIAALERCIQILGSQYKVADAVGVRQPSVSHQVRHGTAVPAEWCLALEAATGGRVTRHELRPDLYPAEVSAAE